MNRYSPNPSPPDSLRYISLRRDWEALRAKWERGALAQLGYVNLGITLHLLQINPLKSLALGSNQVDGFLLVAGADSEYGYQDRIRSLSAGHNPLWYSVFLIVDALGRHAIGSAVYHGPPRDGRVEIGYVVAPPHRGKRVATEAVQILVNQALKQPEVNEVFAQSEVNNTASRRVLEKAGFRHVGVWEVEGHGTTDQWLIHR